MFLLCVSSLCKVSEVTLLGHSVRSVCWVSLLGQCISALVSAIAQCNSSGVSSVCRSMSDVSVFVQCVSSVY